MKSNRFVVQEHETPEGVHWDLMLEQNETLMTFRLGKPPQEAARHPTEAVKIFDHPLRFLSYEGPVQQETGRVHIVDRGTCQLETPRDDLLVLELSGAVLRGAYTLSREEDTTWRLTSGSSQTDG